MYVTEMTALKEYKLRHSIRIMRESSDQMTPWELALQMVDAIPSHLFNTQALVPGSGMGTFALALVHRGWSPDRIVCIEIDAGFALYTKVRSPDINTIHTDYLTWKPNMKFDVIIGNPPYQRPKHAEGNKDNRPLWIDFLRKGDDLLSDKGWMSLLVPSQVAKSTRWNEPGRGFKALDWANILSIKTGLEAFFKVGSLISQVTVTRGGQGLVNVDGTDFDISSRPWLPINTSPEALSIIDKISLQANHFDFKLGVERLSSEWSFGFWRLNQNYGFNPTLTSERDTTKKLMWIGCDCGSKEQAEKLMTLLRSQLFTAFRQITFYEPNYAHLLLSGLTFPDEVPTTDKEIFAVYGLTEAEINFVESLQK